MWPHPGYGTGCTILEQQYLYNTRVCILCFLKYTINEGIQEKSSHSKIFYTSKSCYWQV